MDNLRDLRSLRRSTTDRKIAGVAGGLGQHFNIDPLIIRVVFVVFVFFGGAGLALYGAIWLLVPQDDEDQGMIQTNERLRNALLIGAALVAALMVLGNSWGQWHFPWFLAVLALVAFAILSNRDSNRARSEAREDARAARQEYKQAMADYKAATKADVYRGMAASVSATTEAASATPPGDVVPPLTPTGAPLPPLPPVPPTPPESAWTPPPPRPKRYRGPLLFWPTIALIAIALGVLGIVDASMDERISDAAYPALALGIVGLMLVVGTFFGRPGGLVLLGILLAFVLPAVSIADPRFSGDRDVRETPQFAHEVDDSYFVPAGRIWLDLSQVTDPQRLAGREIDLSGNAGEIVVIVPDDLAVEVDANIEFAGGTEILGHNQGGFDVTANVSEGDSARPLELDIELTVGHIEVRRG